MTYEKTINDMQISLTTDGYPPAVRIHRPSKLGQPDIVMTIDEAGQFINALSDMMSQAMASKQRPTPESNGAEPE